VEEAVLMRWLLALSAIVTSACFDPSYPTGLACSQSFGCPPNQQCNRATMTCFDPEGGVPVIDAGGLDADGIDATPAANGAHLGDLCERASTTCDPFGLSCDLHEPDGTSQNAGMCSLACSTPGQPGVCADGYTKVGKAICDNDSRCSILCGAENGIADACPAGLVCRDTNANDLLDHCLPPVH
jgi:hypothetical protein